MQQEQPVLNSTRAEVFAAVQRVAEEQLYPEPDDATMEDFSSVHSELIKDIINSIDEVLRVNPDSPVAALRRKLNTPGLAKSVCAPGALAVVQLALRKPDNKEVITAAIDACDASLAASDLLPGATATAIMTICAAHCTVVDYLVPRLGRLIPDDQEREAVAEVLELSREAALAKGLELVEEAVAFLRANGRTVYDCKPLTLLMSMAAAAAAAVVPCGLSADEYFAALVQPRGAMELLPNMFRLLSDGVVCPLKKMCSSGIVRQGGDMSVQLAARFKNLSSISNQFYELCLLMDPDRSRTWSDIGGAGCMAGFLKPCARSFYEVHTWLAVAGDCAAVQLLPEATTTDVCTEYYKTIGSRTEKYMLEMLPMLLAKIENVERAQAAAAPAAGAAAAHSLMDALRATLDLNNGANR